MTPPAAAPAARRRWRWRWLLAALLLAAVLAALSLRWLLQPERLGALLLVRAADATGLQLDVASPARLGLWPGLQLELVGLGARLPGAARPLLEAEQADVALPLSVLWSDEVEVGRLDLLQPRVDLEQLGHWLDGRTGADQPPRLPPVAVRIGIRDGTLASGAWSLRDVELDASPLLAGQPFTAAGSFVVDGIADPPTPLQFVLSMLVHETDAGLTIEPLELDVGGGDVATAVAIEGALAVGRQRLLATLDVGLAERWPAGWPAVPEAATGWLLGREYAIRYDGTTSLDAPVELQTKSAVDSSKGDATLRFAPAALVAWLGADAASPLPPAEGSVEVPQVEVDGLVVEGLRIELRGMPPEPAEADSGKAAETP